MAGSQRQSSKEDLWVANADHSLRTRSICQLLRILVTDFTCKIPTDMGAAVTEGTQKQICESGTFLDKSLNPKGIFLDALASLELDMTLTGSPIFREISVNRTFRYTDLQPYNLTTLQP